MLGRPLRIDPLFMKACAGSWLICSVCIDRTMHRSSAIPAMWGNRSEISWPDAPCLANLAIDPRALRTAPCNWASCCPLVNDSGNAWPSSRSSSGLGSNDSNCDGPPAMHRWMTRLAFAGTWSGLTTPRLPGRRSPGSARPRGSSRLASARPPRP